MPRTVEELQAQRDQILAGMSEISHVQGPTAAVSFKSQADMELLLKRLDAEIAALQGTQSRQFTIQTNRGLGT